MATAAPSFERDMSIGRVFSRALAAVRTNPLVILGLAFAIGAVPGLLLTLLVSGIVGPVSAGLTTGSLTSLYGFLALSVVISIVIGALVQGALTRAAVSASEGRKASFGESLSTGLRVALPLIGLGILVAIGVGVGMILLVVPGIILALMWSVAAPALVIERDGVLAALGRSRDLTKGARWKIFGLFLVVVVVYWLLSVVVGIVGLTSYSAGDPAGLTTANAIGSIVLGTLMNAATGTIQPSLYVELRQWKEGTSVENLEQIFA
ncbi:MAG TPA: hypothetical protein VFU80_08505 [Sphingomicrobium sp.]|nr:hypothetical protein [Sphingomicrobium sp.]